MAYKLTVVTSGAHGADGGDGHGGSTGCRGHDGHPGQHAHSARPVTVALRFDDAAEGGVGAAFLGDTSAGGMRFRCVPAPALGDAALTIAARGGDGGHGGDGGRGGHGWPGADGHDATRYGPGTNGQNGGPGGNGGDGGDGGAAGSGAPVVIEAAVDDADLLMLIDGVDICPGRPGRGGTGGAGGQGGRGGRGGASCSWTESVSRSRTVYSSQGSRTEYYTEYTHKHQPGGMSGSPGPPGARGSDGRVGMRGSAGSYTIQLTAGGGVVAAAGERYNLIVTQFEPLGSEDGILEPGEEFTLRGMCLANNGALPTPARQATYIFVPTSEWIEPASPHVALCDVLPPGGTCCLDALPPLRLRLRHAFPLVPNVIPVAYPRLQWQAMVSRVNKRFASVDAEFKTLEVRYPLQLSLVYGARAITLPEEAPFTLLLRNVSTRPSYGAEIVLATESPLGRAIVWRPFLADPHATMAAAGGAAAAAAGAADPAGVEPDGDAANKSVARAAGDATPSAPAMTAADAVALATAALTALGKDADNRMAVVVASSATAPPASPRAALPTGVVALPPVAGEQTLAAPVRWLLPPGALPPGGVMTIRGTLRFADAATQAYSRARLDARLTLAPTGATVQLSDTTLQLGQAYTYHPAADFVLVMTAETPAEEVLRWERLAASVGSRLGVWNVSLYGGVDFSYVRSDGGSLAAELAGKVLIVSNTRYALDASRYKEVVQHDLLLEEVYAAAGSGGGGRHGIHTLVVTDAARDAGDLLAFHGVRAAPGEVYVPRPRPPAAAAANSKATIAAREDAAARQPLMAGAVRPGGVGADGILRADVGGGGDGDGGVPLPATHRRPVEVVTPVRAFGAGGCCCDRKLPQLRHLAAVADARAAALHVAAPAEQQLVLHHFAPAATALTEGCTSYTTSMGTVRVFPGLSAVLPQVGVTRPAPEVSDEQHTFAALKLLPFARKLEYAVRLYSGAAAVPDNAVDARAPLLVLQAVLSDLADEQWVWREHVWSGAFPRERLAAAVVVARTLAAHDWAPMLATEAGAAALAWLVGRYQALLDITPSLLDCLLFSRRRRILSSVCSALLRPLVARLPRAAFAAHRSEAAATFRRAPRAALWESLRNPLGDRCTGYQHWRPAAMVASEAAMVGAGVATPVARRIVEMPHAFGAGAAGEARRAAALASYEHLAHGDGRPVTLFPPRPGAVDVPDNLDDVRTFRGVVART